MKTVIVSGYFNPLHGGHLDMIEAAGLLGDKLVVIVNNDEQQLAKKGKIILDEANRLRLISSLKLVDYAFINSDTNDDRLPVIEALKHVAEKYPDDELIFANGGDRDSGKVVPETATCSELGIKMVYGVGGTQKADSSTRINQAQGHDR